MNTLSPLFLIGFSSHFQASKAGINSRMRTILVLDWIKHLEVTCSCAPKMFSMVLIQRQCCGQDSALIHF